MQPLLTSSEAADCRRCVERETSGCPATRAAISLVIITACFLAAGCHAPTVWKAKLLSPDGRYVAIARTVQSGGDGDAWIDTRVSLKPTAYSGAPTEVLGFWCEGPVPRPYVLDNVANAGGTIDLKMSWVTASHLEVTYSDHASLEFEAVKYQGIDISVRNVARGAASHRNL
jgi:hypothetical protein